MGSPGPKGDPVSLFTFSGLVFSFNSLAEKKKLSSSVLKGYFIVLVDCLSFILNP